MFVLIFCLLSVFFINNICGFTKEFVKTSQMVVEILRFFAFSKWRRPPSWILLLSKNDTRDGAGCECPTEHQIWRRYMKRRLRYGDFPFFKIWIFIQVKNGRYGTLQTVHVYHHAKFGENSSNGGRVIAIFRFSKWRPAAILDFVLAPKRRHGTLRTVRR